ncbi:MAG: protein kinase [Labilithrix sp.]|nr:protein kinase [Labilithrix sp.]MCW5812783.1 protein kinase [Labilithrix sp.]
MSVTDPEDKTLSAPMLPVAIAVAAPAESSNTLDVAPKLLANRYELLGMLGAGAMGTVYRARDRELDEIVALKVLKKELASEDMLERFRREVKLARRVTHRNVARTFDIGEDGGDRFLTMEFIEGEMLGARLARKGRLPLPEVTALALDVCAGLSAAHAANVLHRDLKPENVIVAKDGHAVITDFGIARAAAGEAASRTVGIVGTPAYMAPEQVEGAKDLDARADLYALGAMLFELLTGQQPWTGDTVIAIAASRLLHPPPDPRKLLPNLAPPMAELVVALMARQRDQRPKTADDVAKVLSSFAPPPNPSTLLTSGGTLPLGALGAIKARPGSRVVAVLPIVNLGANEDSYLIEGILEDLVDNLSVVRGLLIRPRGETQRYVDPKRDAREVGRAVHADVVVDASLRRIGDRVRASFRLIAVEDGFQLWAQRFDRAPAEVLTIADDAAAAIAKALTAEVVGEKKERSHDPEAEDLYLRGRYLVRRGWGEYYIEAAQLLERAHQRVPDDTRIAGLYALATARTYGMPNITDSAADKTRLLAEQTLEADPRQPDCKVALGIIHFQNQEVDAAVRYFRQALALNPHGVEPLDWLGRIMAEVGRVEDGVAYLRRASSMDGENIALRYQVARIHSILGDRAMMKQELGPMPSHPGDLAMWFILLARDCMWYRDAQLAAEMRKAVASANIPATARLGIEQMLGIPLGGSRDYLERKNLDRILPVDASRTPRRASFNAQLRAETFGAIDDVAGMFESLRYADGNSLVDVVWLDRCPLFDVIRREPEFVTLRERVGVRARRVLVALDARSPTLA